MIDPGVRDSYDRSRTLSDKSFKSACYAPFVSLLFNTSGNVVACCRSQSFVLGNVARDDLDTIWNGPLVRGMRESLIAYEFGPGCEFCEWMIKAGDYQGSMTRLFDAFPLASAEPSFPQQMEFALANDCNFECIQCSGDWSSRIRSLREGLPPLARVYDERFFTTLARYLPHLKVAKFFGGEPFLIPEHARVWDMMIANGKHPTCFILSNGSIWNARVERVLEHLTPCMAVSLDAVEDHALLERIRIGAKYDQVLGNIARFRDYSRKYELPMSISFTLMRENWTELGPMLLFCEENGFGIDVIRLVDPPHMSLFSLPADEMLKIADALDARAASVRSRLTRLRSTWDGLIHSLRENARKDQDDAYQRMHTGMGGKLDHPVQLAAKAQQAADWEGVLAAARQTEPNDKNYIQALLLMSHAHRRLEQFAEANVMVEKAITLSPRHAASFAERAWLRLAQKQYAESVRDAERALTLWPATTADGAILDMRFWTWIALAQAAGHVRDTEKTVAATDEIIRLRGATPELLMHCAELLSVVGLKAKALQWLRRAVSTEGAPPDIRARCVDLIRGLAVEVGSDSALADDNTVWNESTAV